MTYKLSIHRVELNVQLGWTEQERNQPQLILLDVEIFFPKQPKACNSDELKDTICYADLIEYLRTNTTNKKFKLIEKLAKEIYQLIKKQIGKKLKIKVCVTKQPKIAGLLGDTQFCYDDL